MWEMVNYIGPFQRADCWIGNELHYTSLFKGTDKPNLFSPNVVFFKASPSEKRFYMWDYSKSHDGEIIDHCCYGNGDCGNDYYYRHAAMVISLPALSDRLWLRRKWALLASYREGNILYKLRTFAKDAFKTIVHWL